ncbi:MAG TPA: Rieske 2Fe-2S domain-containing protein [Actinomycetota bacterium]|nr:Rieske 2Fe-2S domain-containing protein [Actinomycetota bacterium]
MSAARAVAASFAVSMAASVALVVVYFAGGQPQLEGVLLALALGGMGLGIVLWGTELVDAPEETEERTPAPATPARDTLELGALTRRRLLVRLLGGAAGVLAGALAIPALSLGPTPGQSLFRTKWRAGARVVDAFDRPLKPSDLPLEGVTTAFPEGLAGEPDSQTLVVRVDPDLLELPEGRSEWAPNGCVGYSKICTHAGCPVGLYRAEAHELLCPCHQSTFDVLRGAEPLFGPAARPLPQLPLGLDDEGYLVARGDFSEPVGPSFWNMTGGDE